MKQLLLVLGIIPFFSLAQQNPQLQWGTSGGSADGGQISLTERVAEMDTDAEGNVYLFSPVFRNNIKFGEAAPGDGHDALHTDILFGSLNCNGEHRWSKIIGGTAGDQAKTLRVSKQGKVYLTGMVNRNGYAVDFGNDLQLPAAGFQTLFLSQYETNGTMNWTKMIQSDTVSGWSYSRTAIIDMDLDEQGNVYLFSLFPPGSKLAESNIKIPDGSGENKIYVLQYNTAGVLQQVQQLDINFSGNDQAFIVYGMHFRRHPLTGNYYVNGSLVPPQTGVGNDVLYLGNQLVSSKMYVGCFSQSGQYLWHKQSDLSGVMNNKMTQSPVDIDEDGNLYFFGQGSLGDSFNGFIFENPLGLNFTNVANFIMKMDASGNRLWAKSGYSMPVNFTQTGTVNHNKVAIGGYFATEMHWDNESISSTGQDGWFAILNKNTGTLEKLGRVEGTGFYDGITAMRFYKKDLFLGGYFANELLIGNQTINNLGGSSDFFVAKYGYDCDCPLPTASFTQQTTAQQVAFTNLSDASVLSQEWDFGDGQTGTGIHPVHHYAANGTYTVCLETTNNCGTDTTCKTVTIGPLSATDWNSIFPNIKMYPNPVKDTFYMDNASPGMVISCYTLTGQKIMQHTLSSGQYRWDTSGLASGVYIINLQHTDGSSAQQKLLKL